MVKEHIEAEVVRKYDKFTERARRVINHAQERSFQHHSSVITPEHLLLGIIDEVDGLAAKALANLTQRHILSLQNTLLQRLERLVGTENTSSLEKDQIPVSGAVQKSIEMAVNEARKLNHHFVGTEHLLLGLLKQEDAADEKSDVTPFFIDINVSYESVLEETKKILNQSVASPVSIPEILRTERAKITKRIIDNPRIVLEIFQQLGWETFALEKGSEKLFKLYGSTTIGDSLFAVNEDYTAKILEWNQVAEIRAKNPNSPQ